MKGSPIADLARRILGEDADSMQFGPLPGGAEAGYQWEPHGAGAIVRGNTPVDQARAFYDYLREAYDGCVAWEGRRLTRPRRGLAAGVRWGLSPFRYRHYLNQVTFSYSTAWWDWPRWEREIDWMALHGFNLPLMALGQEIVWRDTWRSFGIAEDALDRYWSGPAFLPFHRMGCLDSHGGPLPSGWIERQADLGARVLERMRSFGMLPVLPAFAGHVPAELRPLQTDAKIAQLGSWLGFEGTWYLDPTDPLFASIQRCYLQHQQERFGSDHFYAADPFIEVTPTTSDPDALAAIAGGIVQSMVAADPEARWVLQTWPFSYLSDFWGEEQVAGFLQGLPTDRVLLLDLYCDVRELWREHKAFNGRPWLWCVVENFGGRTGAGLHGRLDELAERPLAAMRSNRRGELLGMGLTWEAIGDNAVAAELFCDRAWSGEPIDVGLWLRDWVRRRYGVEDEAALAAWTLLRETVYAAPTTGALPPYTHVCSRPDLVKGRQVERWYPQPTLLAAVEHLLSAADRFVSCELFQHDLVVVTLRALLDVSDGHVLELMAAADACDAAGVCTSGHRVLEDINTAERLASCLLGLRLEGWLADARGWGVSETDFSILERNARLLVTAWGQPLVSDYACRPWAGLFEPFYYHRWSIYIDNALRGAEAGGGLDAQKLTRDLDAWEQRWTQKRSDVAEQRYEDPIAEARGVYTRYLSNFQSATRTQE